MITGDLTRIGQAASNTGNLTGEVTSLGAVTSLGSFSLDRLNQAVSDDNVERMIPAFDKVLWVNTSNGNDSTAVLGSQSRPYKTFYAAYLAGVAASANNRPTIICHRGAASTGETLLLDKAFQFIGALVPNGGVLFNSNITLTIDNADNYLFSFFGAAFTSSSGVSVSITNLTSHQAIFENCHFSKSLSTDVVLQTSGKWDKSSTSQTPAMLRFKKCDIQATFIHGAGTVGDPFDERGICIIENCNRTTNGKIIVNSGSMYVRGPMIPTCTLNGGYLEVVDMKYWSATTELYPIIANNVVSVGLSFICIRNTSMDSMFRGPTVEPGKVIIGENVVYRIDSDALKYENLEIHPNAISYGDYLASIGAIALVAYQSEMLFLAKGLLLPATRQGTATLVDGTAIIANTSITANSKIQLTHDTIGGTPGILSSTKNPGLGFTINSTSASDTSTVHYTIIESA